MNSRLCGQDSYNVKEISCVSNQSNSLYLNRVVNLKLD